MRDCGLGESIGPPEDDLWLPGAVNRLRARLEAEGVTKFCTNDKVKKYQIDKLKNKIREELARGNIFRSGQPGYPMGTSPNQSEDSTSVRPNAPGLSPGRENGRGSPGQILPAAELRRLMAIKKKIDPKGRYVGDSVAILRVFEDIDSLNNFPDAPVLILGPTGAGKTEIAELIHRQSGRPLAKFCWEQAADNLLGDFTSVKGRWIGYGKFPGFQNISKDGANGIIQDYAGGTVFVDEVADLTLEMQGFLRLVLDARSIPLTSGKGDPIRPSVRLIFATNKDLEQAVKERKFRHDLLDRIQRWTTRIPPLVERKEDIFSFVAAKCKGHPPTPEFLLALLRYEWPGNVRELLDVLRIAMAKVDRVKEPLTLDHIQLKDLALVSRVRAMDSQKIEGVVLSDLWQVLRRRGLERGGGLHNEMARLLGWSPAKVSIKIKELGLRDSRPVDRIDPGCLS